MCFLFFRFYVWFQLTTLGYIEVLFLPKSTVLENVVHTCSIHEGVDVGDFEMSYTAMYYTAHCGSENKMLYFYKNKYFQINLVSHVVAGFSLVSVLCVQLTKLYGTVVLIVMNWNSSATSCCKYANARMMLIWLQLNCHVLCLWLLAEPLFCCYPNNVKHR